MRTSSLRLGAHVSIAGGIHKAIAAGADLGCQVIQVFVRPNRMWKAKPLTEEDLVRWFEARERTGVEPAMAHSTYLINLGSPRKRDWNRSFKALADEYERCRRLAISFLVMHPGAHLGTGEAEGIGRIGQALDRLHDEHPDNPTTVLLENTAGQGTNVGYRFEHLRDLLGAVQAPGRVGVCIDTCHTLAAGYDIRSDAQWEETFSAFERVVGQGVIRAFHVNDSKVALGGRVDRHEHLGRGHLGLRAFRCLVNDLRFRGLPMVIETPKPDSWADQVNLELLRSLAGRKRVTARAKRLASQPLDVAPVS